MSCGSLTKKDDPALANELMNFLETFNPIHQAHYCAYPSKCYFGKAPTLAELDRKYGRGTAAMWLVPQIYNLSEYSSAKKMEGGIAQELARVIAANYHFLKVTEMMLFFFRFKNSDYEQFYGSVDALAITRSLKQFLDDRAAAYERAAGEAEKRRCEENRKKAVTREQYDEMLKAGIVKPYKPEK